MFQDTVKIYVRMEIVDNTVQKTAKTFVPPDFYSHSYKANTHSKPFNSLIVQIDNRQSHGKNSVH